MEMGCTLIKVTDSIYRGLWLFEMMKIQGNRNRYYSSSLRAYVRIHLIRRRQSAGGAEINLDCDDYLFNFYLTRNNLF